MQKQDLKALFTIFLLYAVMELVGITCPIRFFTGISCAGCGMSRAWIALLHMDFAAAFRYHPLFWVPIPAVLIFWYRDRFPITLYRAGVVLVTVLFLTVYAVRMFDAADMIVVFKPTDGFLYRIFTRIL
jgi:hypothetical protein